MKRFLITIMILALAAGAAAGQDKQGAGQDNQVKPKWDMEVAFAARDTCELSMDIYFPKEKDEMPGQAGHDEAGQDEVKHPCLLFVYGGGFVQRNQREKSVVEYCRRMADAGFVAVATDYRLGLKGVKSKNLLSMAGNLEEAIKMATEDLFSAVDYLRTYSSELCIDPEKIILAGSSAGAITVLQADYELGNRTSLAAAMPEGFSFAGVISFSGAVFSRKGKCEWTVQPPAPTLFLHGTSDELVPYDKIKFFNMGFFGTNSLVERFEKFDYPYMCLRFDSRYHEVAAFMLTCFDQAQWFIDKYVFQKKNWQIDATVSDPEMDIAKPWTFTAKDIYGK